MTQSVATYFLDPTAVAARDAEMLVAGQFAGGCNLGASNAPGIGIGTGNGQCKLSDWSMTDQAEAARDPQDSQHIGNTGLGAGTAGGPTVPINVEDGADLNDTVSLAVEADGWIRNTVV